MSRRSRRSVGYAIVLATAALILARAAHGAEQTASVTGRVVDDGSQAPLAKARVLLVPRNRDALSRAQSELALTLRREDLRLPPLERNSPDPPLFHSVVADDDGRFSFAGVEPGSYQLLAGRSGYLSAWLENSTRLLIREGAFEIRARDHIDVDVPLMRTGWLRGRVVDPEGRPVTRTMVAVIAMDTSRAAMLTQGRDGEVVPMQRRTEVLFHDDNGAFVFPVGPGLYLLQARLFTAELSRATELVATYYPGVRDQSEAVGIRVGSGETVDGLTLVMQPSAAPLIGGTVLRLAPDVPIDLRLQSPRSTAKIDVSADDRFAYRLAQVDPLTTYVLVARTPAEYGYDVAVEPVDMSTDLSDVLLRLVPGGRVTGHVVSADGSPYVLSALRIAAPLLHNGVRVDPLNRDQVDMDDDGHFEITGLLGERRFEVHGLPEAWMLDRVEIDDKPVKTFSVRSNQHLSGVRIVVRPR